MFTVDTEGLVQTLARYNENAAQGVDPDFGKGSDALNRFNGDSLHQPNPCLRVIDGDNLVAMAVWPAEIASSAGIATDVHARVLSTLVFGYQAAMHAASDAVK